MREVGPGSHYLGCQHTQDNFETAFWRSAVADNNSFEQWQSDGSKDIVGARQRALESHAGQLRSATDRPGHRTRR